MSIRDEILAVTTLTTYAESGLPSTNIGRHAASHVTAAINIARDLPEDPDEAHAILADAARFHAVIRERTNSAVFANVLRKVAEKGIDTVGVG